MNNLIQKISAWLLVSSENPENVSLTLKGLMIGAIPTALLLGGFAHLQLSNEQLTALVDNASNLVTVLLTAVSLGVSGYGLVRKILNNLYDLVHPAPLA